MGPVESRTVTVALKCGKMRPHGQEVWRPIESIYSVHVVDIIVNWLEARLYFQTY